MGALDYPDECSIFADEETEAWGHSRSGCQCSLMATLGPQEHFLGLQPVKGDVGLTDVPGGGKAACAECPGFGLVGPGERTTLLLKGGAWVRCVAPADLRWPEVGTGSPNQFLGQFWRT